MRVEELKALKESLEYTEIEIAQVEAITARTPGMRSNAEKLSRDLHMKRRIEKGKVTRLVDEITRENAEEVVGEVGNEYGVHDDDHDYDDNPATEVTEETPVEEETHARA